MVSPVDALVQNAVSSVVSMLGGGRASTYRRAHSLFDSATGQAPDLELEGNAGIGAQLLKVKASEGVLSGSLPAGFAVTVGAEAHLSSVRARAVAGVVEIALAEPLAGSFLAGEPVEIGATTELTWVRQTSSVSAEDVSRPGMAEAARVELLVARPGYPSPAVDDVAADGLRIAGVEVIGDALAPAGYRVLLGTAIEAKRR